MKRALVLLFLAAGTLAGCAVAPRSAAEDHLRATLYAGSQAPRVSLSEPAYVAIFDVRPGTGTARLVYPDPGADQVPLRRGNQTLSTATAAYRDWYSTTMGGGSNAVLYLVASREPLNLDAFASTRDARRAVGATVLWGNEVREITGALAQAVVSDPEGSGWTESMMWSRNRDNAFRSGPGADPTAGVVSCNDGRTIARSGQSRPGGCTRQ